MFDEVKFCVLAEAWSTPASRQAIVGVAAGLAQAGEEAVSPA